MKSKKVNATSAPWMWLPVQKDTVTYAKKNLEQTDEKQ